MKHFFVIVVPEFAHAHAGRRKAQERKRRSFIYLVVTEQFGGVRFVKVGMSDHPEQRVTKHATSCPLRIASFHIAEFIGRGNAYTAEKTILRNLHRFRCKGEWLRAENDGDMDAIFCAAEKIAPHLVQTPVIQQ